MNTVTLITLNATLGGAVLYGTLRLLTHGIRSNVVHAVRPQPVETQQAEKLAA